MKEQVVALEVSNRKFMVHSVFTLIAIGLGIALPRVFHIVHLGSTFLPMFLPIVILAVFSPLPYVMVASLLTPLLSSLITGIPPIWMGTIMIFELACVGGLIWFFSQKLHFKAYIAIPVALVCERFCILAASWLVPNSLVTSGGILVSYPGLLMISIVGILVAKIYDRVW